MRLRLSSFLMGIVELGGRSRRAMRGTQYATYVILATGFAALAAMLFDQVPILKRIELSTLDLRFRLRPALAASPRLATLDIDRPAIERAGVWPVPRTLYADFARVLSDYDAALMCLDLFFPNASPPSVTRSEIEAVEAGIRDGRATPETLAHFLKRFAGNADTDLAAAMRDTGATVLSFTFTRAEAATACALEPAAMSPQHRRATELARRFSRPCETPEPAGVAVPCASSVELPLPDLLAHAAGLGFAQVTPDVDGAARRYPLLVSYGGRLYPSLALAAVSILTRTPLEAIRITPGPRVILPGPSGRAVLPHRKARQLDIPVDGELSLPVNWAGDYLDTFTHVPATALLRFRAVDMVRRGVRDLARTPAGITREGIQRLTAEVTTRKLLDAAETTALIRAMLLAQIAETRSEVDAGGKDAFLKDFGAADDEAAGATASSVWDQVVCNARIEERLRRNIDEPYKQLKAALRITDDEDAAQRHAAEMLRFLVKRGRGTADWRPRYFFPPVRVDSGKRTYLLSPLDLAGKVFFVGLTATGTHDYNPMPFNSRYPMVGLHLNAANTMLTRQFLRVPPSRVKLWIGFGLALLVAVVTPRLHPAAGAAVLLVVEGLYLVAVKHAFDHAGICLPVSAPFAALAATYVTIVNHRFFLERKEKQRVRDAYLAYKAQMEKELAIAREIQSSALPSAFPAFPGRSEFDLFAAMDPAREVGGDLYDFFFVDPDTLFFMVGDVSGKGIPAALFMMTVKTLMRSEATRGGDPDVVLSRVNDLIASENEANMFVTVLCAALDVRTGAVRLGNAGHNPPLLRSGDAEFRYFPLPPSPVLGIMEGSSFTRGEVNLREGDAFLLYTDGVTEATNAREEMFSEERFACCVSATAGASMREVVNTVRESVRAFAAGAPPSDDVTLLALRFRGPRTNAGGGPCAPSSV